MQNLAADMLRGLFANKDRDIFYILDDTPTFKRAKKMAAVGELLHHVTGKYGNGHTILKVSLYYRGATILLCSWQLSAVMVGKATGSLKNLSINMTDSPRSCYLVASLTL
jgi:hypothetical protein